MKSGANRPGTSARKIAAGFSLKRFCLLLLGLLGIYACIKLSLSLPKGQLVVIPASVGIIFLMVGIERAVAKKDKHYRKRERQAERGALAEEKVGAVLESLKGPYAVFHDVETEYGDIDHVVVSKDHGIFVIETKSHSGNVTVENGKLLVNGKPPEKDFLAQVLRNTMWLQKRIREKTGVDLYIQPILVFSRALVREWKPVRSVLIRNQKYLIEAIEKRRTNPEVASQLWSLHEQGLPLW